MPKVSTLPTLYDEVLTIYISKLIKWGYLEPGTLKQGVLNWSRNGNATGSIRILVNNYTDSENNSYTDLDSNGNSILPPYLELSYNHRDKPVYYRIKLVSVPSNLGKGRVWYFLCPATGKRCRNLYSVGQYFLHREAFTGCLYEKQTYSHKKRQMDKLFESILGTDKLYEQIYSKHFKKYYRGKPTKRYYKLMMKINQADKLGQQYSPEQIVKMYIS